MQEDDAPASDAFLEESATAL
eukprot:gene26749-biopygen17286